MDYSYIINPKTNRKVKLLTKKGISILLGYLQYLTPPDTKKP